MLSLIKTYPGRALAPAFKLKTSVLPLPYVATRYFLTTSPSQSPAQKAGKEASSKPSTVRKSDGKLDVKSKTKSASSTKQDKPPAKPMKCKYINNAISNNRNTLISLFSKSHKEGPYASY